MRLEQAGVVEHFAANLAGDVLLLEVDHVRVRLHVGPAVEQLAAPSGALEPEKEIRNEG